MNAAPPETNGPGTIRHSLKAIAGMALVFATGLIASWYLRFVFAGPAPAEYVVNHPGTTLVAAGQLSFDGEPFLCGRHPVVLAPHFEDYGAALFGFIILNPERFQTLPLAVKRFAYAHECGHQFVGYSETGADCYAVKRGRKEGWLDAKTLEEICAFFSKSKGSPFHLPGPQRCAFIRACYAASS